MSLVSRLCSRENINIINDSFTQRKAIELIYFILNYDICTELAYIDSGCLHLTFNVRYYPSCVGVSMLSV